MIAAGIGVHESSPRRSCAGLVRALVLVGAATLAGRVVADEPDACPVPDPPGVPSVAVPGYSLEGLHQLLVESLPQDPWVIAHVDSRNVSVRRALGEDSDMRLGWEELHGRQVDTLFFEEWRWTLEPRIDETVVTVRDYLVVLGPDGEEQWYEFKSGRWMHDVQCKLEAIRKVVLENEVVPSRENSL